MMDMGDQQCVDTPALFEADVILQDTGHVVLRGPPGCGKTTLARALLGRCGHQGFEPHTVRQVEECDQHSGEHRLSVVQVDGTWGEVGVDCQRHVCWKQVVDTALTLVRKGTLRLVTTVYPHVLRELRQLDKGFQSLLNDHSATVYFTDTLADSVKEQLLVFHLKKVRIEADRQQEIVQRILQTDASGSVFPWCCDHMVNHWDALEDPAAIFSVPKEAHSRLLKEMVLHKPDGRRFAAVFALSMAGLSDFLNHPSKTDRHLQDLGFTKLCSVAGCEQILQGSVLADGQFASRVLYEDAGLALGGLFRLPVLLKVCDCPFLVQYVDMTAAGCVTAGSVPSCSNNTQQRALDHQSLVERLYTHIVQGNLQCICQHPCLHSAELLQGLDNYCAQDGKGTKLLLDAVDYVHELPLLSWSAFGPRYTTLVRTACSAQWCC